MSEAPVKELYRGRADGVRGDEGLGCLNHGRKVHGNIPAPLGKARAHGLRARAA